MKPKTDKEAPSDSLKAAIRDGVSYSVMLGAGETYLGPFGIFLRATTLQVGLLATLPQLFAAIVQLVSAQAMPRFRSRRAVIIAGALAQALLWAPIALLPFVFGSGLFPVFLLIGLVTLYRVANGVTVPVWSSLIGDLVPPAIRGRYFGRRNSLSGMFTFFSMLLAGVVLDVFQKGSLLTAGYLVIFALAMAARLDSARWLSRYEDPVFHIDPEESFTFRQFLRRSPHSNFAKFVFYFGAVNLGVAFSAPYFALYMLRDLQFSYVEFTAVTAMATVTQFLCVRYWGELSDRFGNKKILSVCGWGVAFVPMCWVVSHHIAYLFVIQIFSGLVWAGFNLASTNFIFDAVTPPKRGLCVAYHGLVTGMCVLLGSLAGGYVATRLPASYSIFSWTWHPISPLPAIFLLSGLMRLVAATVLLSKFREVRPVEPIRGSELIFRVSHIKPLAGATFSLITGRHRQEKGDPSSEGPEDSSGPREPSA